MKFVTLLNGFKEKVGLTQSPPSAASTSGSPSSSSSFFNRHGSPPSRVALDYDASPSRENDGLELDFKKSWEEFRSSNSEKDRETALNCTIDCFCKLVKRQANAAQLVTMLVETHIFSFVVGRAFVAYTDNIKVRSEKKSLDIVAVVTFFTENSVDGLGPGSNLLMTVEVLVSATIEKQSLLDSGIFCCLISILNTLLYDNAKPKPRKSNDGGLIDNSDIWETRRFEIEGRVVHIMKALANHPSAAHFLIEDDSLQTLFQMVANCSSTASSLHSNGSKSLHSIQLHRHAMQILRLLLSNDNGSTANYIRKHHLIKVLLAAVKDFQPGFSDPAYIMGIVDLLLECVELSYKPGATNVKLREDIHNAHGYQFLVQFALVLSNMPQDQNASSVSEVVPQIDGHSKMSASKEDSNPHLSPILIRLLDVLVNLSQSGPVGNLGVSRGIYLKESHDKVKGHVRNRTESTDWNADSDAFRVKDLEAVQTLQDILIKADNRELQAEVLNRMFKIFSSHLDNYNLCQELRTVPLFILNMNEFPSSLQEIILKILEYAVTVINCVPEQELLSLCCLMQQPINSDLKCTILSFFVKLLSFDQQYKKVLREVGVLEVLLDDLKQHKFFLGPKQEFEKLDSEEKKSESSSFKKRLDGKDVILSSPKLMDSGSGKFPIFEIDSTIPIAWDCLVSLIKKADVNQASFRAAGGVTAITPLLVSDIHRPGVLRVLSCLISEDSSQAYSGELGMLVELLKSGMVISTAGHQYILHNEAKCDVMVSIWRILGVNKSAQAVFGDSTGFSLLLTTLHRFQGDDGERDNLSLDVKVKVFTYLLRLVAAGVCDSAVNRTKLHTVLSSHTFFDLLSESGLINVDYEKLVIQLLFEVSLEIVIPPYMSLDNCSSSVANESNDFYLSSVSGISDPYKERVYNPSAIKILIRSLLLLTPKTQLDVLSIIEKLARAGPFNQENLTSVGCVQLLLEIIQAFLLSTSSILSHTLRIVEVLGAYRLSTSELRLLLRYILQIKMLNSGHILVETMERLVTMEDMGMESASLGSFVEFNMTKTGHASIQVSLGERTWPPAAGYTFVCWFQVTNFLKPPSKDSVASASSRYNGLSSQQNGCNHLRIFCVGTASSDSTLFAELYLQEDGTLILATSNNCCVSFPGLDLEEGRWHHLAVVHSKPNALAGFFQASFAYVFLNGKLRHTGKLGYSPSPPGKPLQVTIGQSQKFSRVSDLQWKLRSCYLFEEVLTSGSIFFMYILSRRYRGIFQDSDLLRFVPIQACGGGSMAIMDSLNTEMITSNLQKFDITSKLGDHRTDGSGIVWDLERLDNLSLQLSGKKLIFAFDGMSIEIAKASGTSSLLNLVDPLSAAASPIGGIPRVGRIYGDIYVCRQRMIGDVIRPVGGIPTILTLVESAKTRNMLHMALALLAAAIHQNPQNVKDMQKYRGYHLLALFLRRSVSLLDSKCLEIFFQIAACEASFSEPKKLEITKTVQSPVGSINVGNFDDSSTSRFYDDEISLGSHDIDDLNVQKDSFSHVSELENTEVSFETSNCIVLANPDMVEHVLLDWTLWVVSPVHIQISLLGFLEQLVSMHWYRNHNLAVLRQINLVQHLLVTLQRGDVEISVLEKLVVLLGVILEDGFLVSELETVVKFLIMTFDPPDVSSPNSVIRESMGKHVIVRNMLFEMLIDLLVTIRSEELIEQWHKIVSSKLITYFLDEAVYPTSMRWVITLLGVCLASSPTFALKFRITGGYQGLIRVLAGFYDAPDIYYILFCLMFNKPVYPRLPEVRMLDFHALVPSDGGSVELKFVELLESVIAMAKSTFDRIYTQATIAQRSGSLSHSGSTLVFELLNNDVDMVGELQGEALMYKTYAARLMGGEASAPVAAVSILRFMVDLVKMCPSFSSFCRRSEFLESCIDLYFTCVRAACALEKVKSLSKKKEEKNVSDFDDTSSSQNTFSSLPQEHDQSEKNPNTNPITGSDEASAHNSNETVHLVHENLNEPQSVAPDASISKINDFQFARNNFDASISVDSQSSSSIGVTDSSVMFDKLSTKSPSILASQVNALSSSIGGHQNENKVLFDSGLSLDSSHNVGESEQPTDQQTFSQNFSLTNDFVEVNSNLLIEIDDSGYGGGPCSAGANAMLDFLAEVLSNYITEQIKSALSIESILEMVPLCIDVETMLVFQGLCLCRLMNFVERRLLRDDEENEKKLDRNRWSPNVDALCGMIVDRMYIGAFPQPSGVFRTLEFLLSLIQLANKDGRLEESVPLGKGLLSITRGMKQIDAYMNSLLKNMNRVLLYCFLPPFLSAIGEDDLLLKLGFLANPKKRSLNTAVKDDMVNDIGAVLHLISANRTIVFCPSNVDADLNCCLCVNLVRLIRDSRQHVQTAAIDVLKSLLVTRRNGLEDLLVSKPNQEVYLDLLHNGFDLLLTRNLITFFEWFQDFETNINKVLEQHAAVMWHQFVAESAKSPGVKIKGFEGRRKKEMGRKLRETPKLDQKHFDQLSDRRFALELIRDSMATQLRVIRQDKYGWILHAESEWQILIQQLIHERGVFPLPKIPAISGPDWQHCSIEGPFRMRKKFERCKVADSLIQDFLDSKLLSEELTAPNLQRADRTDSYDIASESFSNLFESNNADNDAEDDTSIRQYIPKDDTSVKSGWIDDKASSMNETSLHSALDFGVKSSTVSAPVSDVTHENNDTETHKQSSSSQVVETKTNPERFSRDMNDNGEYLIRPFLEPFEKIIFKYNCERVLGLDKHDGVFLIGEISLYVIENFFIDDKGCICEKECEDELSIIDQELGVKKASIMFGDFQSKSSVSQPTPTKMFSGGRVWAYNGGAWGKEKVGSTSSLPHTWQMWTLNSVNEILKRDYQLRPVAVEIFSMDGRNDLLVFHKKERDDVFKNLLAMNLPRNSMLDTTISGSIKQDGNEGSRFFKTMAKSFSKRWQNGEISNFQYLMHLNTLAGRGYSDLTQYPVFPWILANYESENLDLSDPKTFRKLDKPIGCQTPEGEDEFRKRYESWDDPEVPKFHYGSHYSSAGIVLFYLVRLPPFSAENQKLQGGQFDHADRLFNSVKDTWASAAGRSNTSDVKELIPEFFYMPEFLENRFNLDLGEKQSGEKVGDVVLPKWAKGSAWEFIRKHREALESPYVSENLHHWIDLIFGYKQRGKGAEDAVNVFYHYTYEGSVDIDSVKDPAMKASILAQINHFGQTPKQLFLKPHVKRHSGKAPVLVPLKHSSQLVPRELRKWSSPISQIVSLNDKLLLAGPNTLLKPRSFAKCLKWGFPDCSLRFMAPDLSKLLSTHENLHDDTQIHTLGVSHDGHTLVTGADDGVLCVWRIAASSPLRLLHEKTLCAHTARVTCLHVCQPYMLVVSGSDDCTVILWDLSSLSFVRQLPLFPVPVSAVFVNDLSSEILTAAGVVFAVWTINGDCLAAVNTSQLPSDCILCVMSCSAWECSHTSFYVTGHQSGAVKVWEMVHCSSLDDGAVASQASCGLNVGPSQPEYRLNLKAVLKAHKHPVTALHLTSNLRQLLSGDSHGHLLSWTLPEDLHL